MKWVNPAASALAWSGEISNYDAKLEIAKKVARKANDGDVIGAGSGSTSYLTLQEIARRVKDDGLKCRIVPTSREIEMAAGILGLQSSSLLTEKPDWYFDGADEVDPAGNLIKGRGGAMFREKLVMRSAKKTYILVDPTKFVDGLGAKFPVPVEVCQDALHYVEESLQALGTRKTELRLAKKKDGPVVTESGNFIIDVEFSKIDAGTEAAIKKITGVVESGLFWGYTPEIVSN